MRVNAVNEAEIWPSSEGVTGVDDAVERSRAREVDCLRAALNCEFFRMVSMEGARGKRMAYHCERSPGGRSERNYKRGSDVCHSRGHGKE